MSLSARIMNLPVPEAAREWPNYGVGHRDARHAAAELAAEADAIRDELVTALEAARAVMTLQRDVFERGKHAAAWNPAIEKCDAALARTKGQA